MKQILTVFLIIALFVGCISGVNALEANENVFYYQSKEIIINDNNLDYSTKKMIADYVADDTVPTSTFAINCLLGHSLAYTTAYEIKHNVRTGGFNCDQNIYNIEYCARNCGYIVKTLTSSVPTNACHG